MVTHGTEMGIMHQMKYITTFMSHSVWNALDEEPVFHTRRLTTDPVQVGAICLNSGDCRSDQGGSNRNLLDFNDLHIDSKWTCVHRYCRRLYRHLCN